MVARMWTGLGHRIWEKGSSLVTPPGKQLASLGAAGSWESRRYLLVEVWDGGLFGGGANGNGPDRGAPDDGGRGASGQRPLRRIPLLIPSLQRPLGQGIIQHGHRRHLLWEKREGHPPGVTGWDREEGPCPPPSSCRLSMSCCASLGSPCAAGHSRSARDCQEHPIWDNRAWGGNSGSPPSPAEPGEGWERVGHTALQSPTLNETTTT